jgi:GTP-binding protein Era
MMDEQMILHCGVAAIIGRPNTGKSTLLNRILDEKVAIVSKIPQTTRYKIRGIYTDQRGQIVFIDTPGMHIPRHQMGKYMLRQIDDAIATCDLIIHLVDATKSLGEEEQLVIDKIKDSKVPIILGLNKIDINPKFLNDYIEAWEEAKGKKITELTDSLKLIPLSALSGTNLDKLMEVIFDTLPEGEMLYPKDMLTDLPERLAIADIIREKLFELLRQEIPHSLAVYIEEMQPRSHKLIYIRAIILIERESQKSIIIGKQGEFLKETGSRAREEIEKLLEKKVFLETFVKVKPHWRQDHQILKQLGYI